MRNPRSNRWFWTSTLVCAVVVTFQSISLYGPLGAPMGIGTGAALGMVVFYVGAMVLSAARWIRQQMQRP